QRFSSLDECVRYGKPQDLCQAAYDEALAAHARSAPVYISNEACLAGVDVSQCASTEIRENDGNPRQVFMPRMAGFSIARAGRDGPENGEGAATGGGGHAYYGGRYRGSPLYQSGKIPDGYWGPRELRA